MPQNCAACALTLTDACLQRVPPQLCGLCRLLTPEMLRAYFATWDRAAAETLRKLRQEDAA
jgi:hypothetical protein